MANQAELLIIKLMKYYDVNTITELAQKIGSSQPAISQWKKNNYVNAIGNKTKELGIYDDIFGDIQHNDLSNSNFSGNSTGVDNSSNKQYGNEKDELIDCDDFTKSLFKELCKQYKDKSILQKKLFELIQNANSK